MKISNEILLLTSLLTIGLVPTISALPVQAASTEYTIKKFDVKKLYFLIGKNELVNAKDIRITNGNSPDAVGTTVVTNTDDFRVVVTSFKAPTYDLKGTKLSHTLPQGDAYSLGSQSKLTEKSYYKVGSKHLVPMTEVE